MKMRFVLSSILLAILMAGVSSAQNLSVKKRIAPIARYNLNIRLLPDQHRLEANGTILLPPAKTGRESIELGLDKVIGDLRVEVLQPVGSRGIAAVEKKEDSSGSVTWNVRPSRPFPAGEPISLRFSYAGGAASISGLFYVGPEASIAAAGWYPTLNNVRGVGSLRFTVPAGETVVATGGRRSRTAEEANGSFQFEVDFPAYFSFAAGKYTIVKGKGNTPVSAYCCARGKISKRTLIPAQTC
jgi:hypothetical protein